jgi:hypothetical protein
LELTEDLNDYFFFEMLSQAITSYQFSTLPLLKNHTGLIDVFITDREHKPLFGQKLNIITVTLVEIMTTIC